MSSLSEDSSPETLELFLNGWRFFLPIIEPSLSSESGFWLFTSGDDERDFLDVTLFGLAELDFDLLLLVEVLLRLVEWLAWDVSLLPLATDWLDVIEPAGEAERADVAEWADTTERADTAECADSAERADIADTAETTLEALLPGDGEREPAGDFEGLLEGDAEPETLLERDLDAGDVGSEPEGVCTALAGVADLDDWLLLLADDELETDSESLASE